MSPTERERAEKLIARLYPKCEIHWALTAAEYNEVVARDRWTASSSQMFTVSTVGSAVVHPLANQAGEWALGMAGLQGAAAGANLGAALGSFSVMQQQANAFNESQLRHTAMLQMQNAANVRREPWMSQQVGTMQGYGLSAGPLSLHNLDNNFHVIAELIGLGVWGVYYNTPGQVMAIQRPNEVLLDDRGRPHCTTGPAITFGQPDFMQGFDWFLHGVRVPSQAITEPESIPMLFQKEANAEVRRVMAEHYGIEKLMLKIGRVIAQDDYGKLWGGIDTAGIVEVQNSTPEPDGTFRTYFLKVPPGMTSAKAAVAWTFGMTEKQYDPVKQT